jgi:Holliday junction resolvase RusA-like endonuclease
MKKELTITIPGKPIAKKRPRFFRKGQYVGTYNDQRTEEGRWLYEATRQIPNEWIPLKTPIKTTMVFYMQRPKSHYGTGKNSNILKKSAPLSHTSKPDIDNLQKMVYDCLNRVAWVDDSCVCEVVSRKEYSDTPRTEITISEVIENG